MFKFLASLFGGGDTTNKIVDGVINGADSMFFTDQEKSEANLKILNFKLEWMKATQGQNIARRIIAIMVTSMWMMCGVLILATKGFGADDFSTFAYNYMKDIVNSPFMIIIGFYFLAHVVRGASSATTK